MMVCRDRWGALRGWACMLALCLLLPGDAEAQTTPILGNTVQIGHYNYCADAGSTDAYACSHDATVLTYVTGARYTFKANTVNTGAATFNLNGIGARTIKRIAGGVTADLQDGDICAGQEVDMVYDGTNLQMVSQRCAATVTTITMANLPTAARAAVAVTLSRLGGS